MNSIGSRACKTGSSGCAHRSLAPVRPALRQGGGHSISRDVIVMGNKATTGPFAPLVRATRGLVGQKDFNKFRGKAISLHSQARCSIAAHASTVTNACGPRARWSALPSSGNWCFATSIAVTLKFGMVLCRSSRNFVASLERTASRPRQSSD
jgi:hypothetical protein